jgi:hypothetical protein
LDRAKAIAKLKRNAALDGLDRTAAATPAIASPRERGGWGSLGERPRPSRRRAAAVAAQGEEAEAGERGWSVSACLQHDDLDIQKWLDMEEPADIYVLG